MGKRKDKEKRKKEKKEIKTRRYKNGNLIIKGNRKMKRKKKY